MSHSTASITQPIPVLSGVELRVPRKRLIVGQRPDVPAEQTGSLLFGLVSHLGPAVVFCSLLVAFGLSVPLVVGLFLAIAVANLALVLACELWAPSVHLSVPRGEQVTEGLSLVFATGFVGGGVVVCAGWWLLHHLHGGSGQHWAAIGAVVMLTDYAY